MRRVTQFYLLVVLAAELFSMTWAQDYCSLSCNGTQNTVCEYPAGGGPECSQYEGGLNDEDKRMIVNLHNQLRQRVAMGLELRGAPGPQPSSSNMRELVWNEELATVAQRWADQCQATGHDRCRRTASESSVGQNIASSSGYGRIPTKSESLQRMIRGWYDEVRVFDRSQVPRFTPDSNFANYGHYSQLVWATTRLIGCGWLQKTDTSTQEFDYKLVCNYAPAGNFPNRSVYLTGLPCTACPTGTRCSLTTSGLCR